MLFPSWNFFDQIGYAPELSYRASEADEWINHSFSHKTRIGNLILNPIGNLKLAQSNLIIRLMQESQEGLSKDTHNWVTYQLVKNLAESFSQGTYFQFKITVTKDNLTEDLLISPFYELKR